MKPTLDRPDLLGAGREVLSPLEQFQLAFVRKSFDPGPFANGVCWLQRNVGSRWIRLVISNLYHAHHEERLPDFSNGESYIMVANHRSFFDLYTIFAHLVAKGLKQRIVFPVRSTFFYDNPLGLFVNGSMSFFAMYPPVFRDGKKASLNTMTLDELSWLLQQGGHFVGFHPEGTRNMGDPYTLLPARTGIGRLVHQAKVRVIPAFVNGLNPNSFVGQIRGNFDGKGDPIHAVFGKPIDFGTLLDEPASQSVFKRIANKTRHALMELGAEERDIRARF